MNSIVKSMALGLTVGAVTYAVTSTSGRQKRKMKSTAGKAIKAIGSAIDGISYMVK